MNGFLDYFAGYFAQYGYWTIAGALLLENAGIPVPGETVLVAASAIAQLHGSLSLGTIILVGTMAATAGDNIGYALGRWGGRRLLERYRHAFHIRPETIRQGERLFARYGAATVFFARFIVGLRVLAGPLAGVLRMRWFRFSLFNALGAAAWVTAVASVSYAFARRLPALLHTMRAANLVVLALAILAAAIFGRRLLARLGSE